jgi:hypothetical protein
MKTATETMNMINLRERRAFELAHAIMKETVDFVPRRLEREFFRRLVDVLETAGVEVITDAERERAGLPPRGPEGWTAPELLALERAWLEALYKPMIMTIDKDRNQSISELPR